MDFPHILEYRSRLERGKQPDKQHLAHNFLDKDLHIYCWNRLCSQGSLYLLHILDDILHRDFPRNQADKDKNQHHHALCRWYLVHKGMDCMDLHILGLEVHLKKIIPLKNTFTNWIILKTFFSTYLPYMWLRCIWTMHLPYIPLDKYI